MSRSEKMLSKEIQRILDGIAAKLFGKRFKDCTELAKIVAVAVANLQLPPGMSLGYETANGKPQQQSTATPEAKKESH
jgi:hypothetical protein